MKKRWLMAASVLVCAGVALLGLPGCNDDDEDTQGTGALGGNVLSFHSAAPAARLAGVVAGVEVTITGPVTLSAVTDANGVFSFPDLPPGEYTMSFKYNGMDASYEQNGVPVVIVVGEDQSILLVDIVIEEGVVTVGHLLVCNEGEECVPPTEAGLLPAPKQLSPPDGSVFTVETDGIFSRKGPAKAEEDGQIDREFEILGASVAATTDVTLKWKAVPGAAAYVVEIQRDQARDVAIKLLIDPAYVRCEKELVSGTSFKVSLPAGIYRWRVWAVDENGVFGRKSGWWDFLIGQLGQT